MSSINVSDYGLTPAQYHHCLDMLWAALGKNGLQGENVYVQASERIVALEKERDELRAQLERLEGMGAK